MSNIKYSLTANIPRTLELFVQSMLTKTLRITNARNAKTLSPSHMKQCIMSENRFDFLRELVKNIPDINVAEEQMAADNYPDRRESDETPSPPIQPPNVEATASSTSNGLVNSYAFNSRNGSGGGTKRSNEYPLTTEDIGPSASIQWKYNKQHSLDSISGKLSTSDAIKNQNFYTEYPKEDSNPIISYSIKFDTSDKSDNNRVPKLTRIDSAPATYSPNSKPSTPVQSCYLPITSTTMTTNNQPIINFDFTKVPFLPLANPSSVSAEASTSVSITPIINSQTNKTNRHPIPELLPMISGNSKGNCSVSPIVRPTTSISNHSVAKLMQKNDSKIQSTVSEVNDNHKYRYKIKSTLPPSVIKLDLINSPLIKIDYSNLNSINLQQKALPKEAMNEPLNLSTSSSQSHHSVISSSSTPLLSSASSSSSSTSTSSSSSSTNRQSVININFSKASVAPIISYSMPTTTISNSSTLEMDEDYDNE